jgi:hypothetical protein
MTDAALDDALIALWRSQTVSSSTLPPGVRGIGGQAMTGWVRAERVADVLDAIEASPRLRARLSVPDQAKDDLAHSGTVACGAVIPPGKEKS